MKEALRSDYYSDMERVRLRLTEAYNANEDANFSIPLYIADDVLRMTLIDMPKLAPAVSIECVVHFSVRKTK